MKQGGVAPPDGWPARGTITYQNVTASYRPGLSPVLSNLSFTIQVCDHLLCLCCLAKWVHVVWGAVSIIEWVLAGHAW